MAKLELVASAIRRLRESAGKWRGGVSLNVWVGFPNKLSIANTSRRGNICCGGNTPRARIQKILEVFKLEAGEP